MATGGGSRPPPRARRPRLRGGPCIGRPPPLLQRPGERAGRVPVVLPLGDARAGKTGRGCRPAPLSCRRQRGDVPLILDRPLLVREGRREARLRADSDVRTGGTIGAGNGASLRYNQGSASLSYRRLLTPVQGVLRAAAEQKTGSVALPFALLKPGPRPRL